MQDSIATTSIAVLTHELNAEGFNNVLLLVQDSSVVGLQKVLFKIFSPKHFIYLYHSKHKIKP